MPTLQDVPSDEASSSCLPSSSVTNDLEDSPNGNRTTIEEISGAGNLDDTLSSQVVDLLADNLLQTNEIAKKDHPFLEIPVHSIVLCLNSVYFKKLFVESGMKETSESTVTIKVNQGEGKSFELLIESFYNQDVLKDLSMSDLLLVLDIADRFSCTTFIEQGLKLLEEKKIDSVEECDTILQYVSRVFQSFGTDEKFKSTKSACVKFLSDKFFPLEVKLEQQSAFKQLHYQTVLSLLRSSHTYAVNEASSFILMYRWLEGNPDHQTPEVIKTFLSAIRYEALTVSFLTDELTVCDQMLNKWSEYPNWFSTALKFHSLTYQLRELRGLKTPPLAVRSITSSLKNVLYSSKRLVFNSNQSIFLPTEKTNFIWNGVCFYPIVTLKKNQNSDSLLKLKLIRSNEFMPQQPVGNFYQSFELYFCILPGYLEFKLSLLKQKKFVTKMVRKICVTFKCSNVCCFTAVAKLDDMFTNALEENGMDIILFFKKSSYTWGKLETNAVNSSDKLINFTGNRNLSKYFSNM